jgi:hypothetical protein
MNEKFAKEGKFPGRNETKLTQVQIVITNNIGSYQPF